MLLSGYQTAIQLAALGGFWAAYAAHAILPNSSLLQWQIPVAIQLIPGVLLLLGTLITPESPRFLAEKGQLEGARDTLAWLRSLPVNHADVLQVVNELRESTATSDELHAEKVSLLRALKEKSLQKRLMVGVGLMVAQNMVGLNALNYCESSPYPSKTHRSTQFC